MKIFNQNKYVPISVLICLALISILMALVSPVFSGPDDDFHLSSIYCANGQTKTCGGVEKVGDQAFALVPNNLAKLIACKGRDISISQKCFAEKNINLNSRIRTNNGGYPELFYKINNLFIVKDVYQSVVLMRLLSILFFLLSGVVTLILISPRLQKQLVLILTLCFVPFPSFFFATNNPQVWSLTLIPFTIAILFTLFNEKSMNKNKNLVTIIISSLNIVLIIGSRPDGIYITLAAIALTFIASGNVFNRHKLITAFFLIAYSFIISNFLPVAKSSIGRQTMDSINTGYSLHNFLEFPGFLLGVLGNKGDSGYLSLGSYDLPLPSMVPIFLLVAWLIVFSIVEFELSQKVTLLGGIFGCLFVMFYGLNQMKADTSGIFQPRYLLAFLFCTSFSVLISTRIRFSRFKKILVASLLIFAGSAFYYAFVARYSSGIVVDRSLYLEQYSIPNSYVSKKIIHWKALSGTTSGYLNVSATATWACLTFFWVLTIILAINIQESLFTKKINFTWRQAVHKT